MNYRLDNSDEDDVDILIGSVILLLLKQNEDITPQSVLKAIKSPVFSGEKGRNEAERVILDSLKGSYITRHFHKKILH